MSTKIKRLFPDTPLVAVSALIYNPDKSKLLLIRRKCAPSKGKLSFPGGLIDVGETYKSALKREIEEEVGIIISIESIIDVVDNIVKDAENSENTKFHYVIIVCSAKAHEETIHYSDEVDEAHWVPIDKINDYLPQMTFTSKHILKKEGILNNSQDRFTGIFKE